MPWYGLDEGARALIPHSQLYFATPLNNVQSNNQMCKCKENSKCGSRLTAVQNVLWQDINLHAIATRHSDVGCDYLSFDFFRDKFYNYCSFFLSYQGNCCWQSVTGRRMQLKSVDVADSSEIERRHLQKAAYHRLQAYNVGPIILPRGKNTIWFIYLNECQSKVRGLYSAPLRMPGTTHSICSCLFTKMFDEYFAGFFSKK